MPSPFPGMNPYLEHPSLWSGVHHRLITAIANDLAPQIRPKYIAAIEEQVYEINGKRSLLVGIPDVSVQQSGAATDIDRKNQSNIVAASTATQPIEVTLPMPEILTESFLEIRAVATGEVIAAIEILSPKNKQSTLGRLQYETKRQKVLASQTHFVEIDLLRQGEPTPVISPAVSSDYRILISRSDTRPQANLYAFNLPDKIPLFTLPLHDGDTEPIVDLHKLIDEIYNQGGYDLRLDYNDQPPPPLSEVNADWISRLLRDRQLI